MIKITLGGGINYELTSPKPMNNSVLRQFVKYGLKEIDGNFVYSFPLQPSSSFVLKAIINSNPSQFDVDEDVIEMIDEKVELAIEPSLFFLEPAHVGINCPGIPYYTAIMNQLGARELSYNMFSVPFSRSFEVIRMLSGLNWFLPNFTIEKSLEDKILVPLESFDGTLSSLYSGAIDDLFTVKNAYKAKVENFNKAGYNAPVDFAMKQPLRYIDKTKVTPTEDWKRDEEVVFIGKIFEKEVINFQHALFKLKVGNEAIEAIFYRRQWMSNKYSLGEEVLVIGKMVSRGRNAVKITGSSMDSLIEANALPIVPIYSQSSKNLITTKIVMNCVTELFTRLKPVTKDIAGYIDSSKLEMSLQKAIYSLHFPTDIEDYKKALNVLAFYELIYMQLLIIHRKATEEKKKGLSKPFKKDGIVKEAIKGLPFELTDSQKNALNGLNKIMSSDSAEQALISADVGSGKTILAQLTCLQAVDNGYQAVLAAPTEVLASQLYKTFVSLLDGIPQHCRPSIVFLTGALKAAERRQILKSIEYGEVDLIVGTHSVLNNKIKYKNLGVVCIDEQQKFGAAQRNSLLEIRDDGFMPDIISQTATPIPRSTAQIFYGDIDLIVVDQKPKGRKEIITHWIKEDPRLLIKDKKHQIWKDILDEAKLGHKSFVVVPMVHENNKVNAASVQETVKELSKVLPGIEIEFVHGQMKKPEQLERIKNFKEGNASVLVGSTVIEVGVDIPEATRMVILSADRLGASSLHQIRGRVGRNSLQSICYLVSDNLKKANTSRLESLVNSNNGFDIATADLHTRGEGDLFGEKQAGDTKLNFANLVDHSTLIDEARQVAEEIYKTPRKLEAIQDAKAILTNMDDE